jgi:hypothetical protein
LLDELSNNERLFETIPRSEGFKTPRLAAESVSKACLVVHTRDFSIGLNAPGSNLCCGCELQDRNLIPVKSNIRKGLFCQKKKCNGTCGKITL